jgi:hypothetical protein
MSRPPKGRNPQRGRGRTAVPSIPPTVETETVTSPGLVEQDESSPLTAQEETSAILEEEPVHRRDPNQEAYDRFGEDFDQEDDVDDYVLLHPGSPQDAVMGTPVQTAESAVPS